MNSTIGIEYAYARIYKLEVEALAYKDKIAELEAVISLDVKLKELQVEKIIASNKKQWEKAQGGAE